MLLLCHVITFLFFNDSSKRLIIPRRFGFVSSLCSTNVTIRAAAIKDVFTTSFYVCLLTEWQVYPLPTPSTPQGLHLIFVLTALIFISSNHSRPDGSSSLMAPVKRIPFLLLNGHMCLLSKLLTAHKV